MSEKSDKTCDLTEISLDTIEIPPIDETTWTETEIEATPLVIEQPEVRKQPEIVSAITLSPQQPKKRSLAFQWQELARNASQTINESSPKRTRVRIKQWDDEIY